MNVKYYINKNQAIKLSTEFFTHSPIWKHKRLLLILPAILIACVFSALYPIKAYHNEEFNLQDSIISTVAIQVPVATLLFYALLRAFSKIPIKAFVKEIKKQPDEMWGERTLEINDGEITFRRNLMTTSFKTSFVTDVIETPGGYHVLRDKKLLFSVPRSACSLEEIRDNLIK